MKPQFITIQIKDKCLDLPLDMPIPQKGDVVFIEETITKRSYSGTVDHVNYHYTDGRLYMISIFTNS